MIGLQRQEERGDADGYRGDQRQLDRLKRIDGNEEQRQKAEDHRKRRLDQEQGSRALDIVDDAAPFVDDVWKMREIGIEQHEVGDVLGRLAALRHGDGAVCLLQRHDIIDTVSGHGRATSPLLSPWPSWTRGRTPTPWPWRWRGAS